MYLLFDIGGTKMRLAISADGANFNEPKIVATPKDYNESISVLKKTALELSLGSKITAVSGGLAGLLNKQRTTLVYSPYLKDWVKKPILEDLEKIFECPVYLENQAAVVGLGEATHGAGRGFNIVAYISVSTGVGGARIVNGFLDRNSVGGFEPGHQIINLKGNVCSCGVEGHLEAYIAGSAVEAIYGKKPFEITDEKIWNELAYYLAVGLNNTVVHWSPDIIVLGGSMFKEVGISLDKVNEYLLKIATIFPELPRIEKAVLGDAGGIYGAIEFIRQKMIKG